MRAVFRLRDFITPRHLDRMAVLMLITGLLVTYSYAVEVFNAFFGGHRYEIAALANRYFGPYAPVSWSVVLCNVAIPQALWLRFVRARPAALFVLGVVVLVGMWLERFMIIVASLNRDFMPSAWHLFEPTFWDLATLAGSIGAFAFLFLLFLRFLPAISMSEMRKLVRRREPVTGTVARGELA
jgi:molybdopterin-containing oxidoreductase family membrane subunit